MNRVEIYSNIHSHDYFSILDGHSSPEELLERCKKLRLKALATTNHGNEFAFYYYAKLKKKFPKIKILYGVEFYEAFNHLEKDQNNKYFHLLVLAKNKMGIQAIHQLITKSNFEGFYYKPRIDLNQMKPYAKDLIITSACLGGKIAKSSYEKSLEYVKQYKSIFGENFYLEMQVHRSEQQILFNKKILKLSKETNTPYIITNDNHYSDKSKQYAHAHFVNINRKNSDVENLNEIYEDCYIHSVDEIYDIMMDCGFTEDQITVGLQNTNIIADLCNGEVEFGEPDLPHIQIPPPFKNEEEWFKSLIMDGWKKKIEPKIKDNMVYNEIGTCFHINVYKERVKEEFETMKDMDFIGYHLIVSDYIRWAKRKGIAVADGRGSASGSLINYLIDITGLDPIPYGLLFSRYINKDRISLCDIDSDFQSDRRWEVFDYIKNKYGENKVAQIINFTYITPKVAIKDAGRCILGKVTKDIENLAEFMTQDTIDESIEKAKNNPKLRKLVSEYANVIALAKEFDGRPRSLMINACGSVITSKPIYEYCGMMKGEEGELLLQVDKKITEELGMVKMDLLATKVLQLISNTMQKIGKTYYDVKKIPLNDKETYDFLSKGNLYGVFQLESYNMTKFFTKLTPKNILDICAGISLYRPASMKYLDDYIAFKNDSSLINYAHSVMSEILDETYSIIVYQEQIMFLLQKLAGFTFAQSDLVRRGIGKKDMEYILAQKDAFIYGDEERNIIGCINNGLTEEQAKDIFHVMEDAGSYCFNKSHGVSYALLTYYTAYLKCHHTLEFMETLLSLTSDNMKISQILSECKKLNVKVINPDINESKLGFRLKNDYILYGISSLQDVGDSVTPQIIKNRPYSSFENFLEKNNNKIEGNSTINKSALISLVNSGCFDNLPIKDNDNKLSSRVQLLGKIFYNSESLIKSVSTIQLPELLEIKDIDLSEFKDQINIYNLHKKILKKKNKLNIYSDSELLLQYQNYYSDVTYNIENETCCIIKHKYNNEYNKHMKLLKKHLKDNSEQFTMIINKNRVLNSYLNYRGTKDDADLEFESTSFYFQDSWLNSSKEEYGISEFHEIPNIELTNKNRYKKKQLYIIVGVLIGKIKKHKEILLLTNSGVVIAKLGDMLYNSVAADLKRCNKIALSGYVGNGFFRVEYYDELGKSNKLMSLKVIE